MSDATHEADPLLDPTAAADFAALCRVLSHPPRLRLLLILRVGERSVTALARELGVPQPTLSQQLGVLLEAGLGRARRAGRSTFYSAAGGGAGELAATRRVSVRLGT